MRAYNAPTDRALPSIACSDDSSLALNAAQAEQSCACIESRACTSRRGRLLTAIASVRSASTRADLWASGSCASTESAASHASRNFGSRFSARVTRSCTDAASSERRTTSRDACAGAVDDDSANTGQQSGRSRPSRITSASASGLVARIAASATAFVSARLARRRISSDEDE